MVSDKDWWVRVSQAVGRLRTGGTKFAVSKIKERCCTHRLPSSSFWITLYYSKYEPTKRRYLGAYGYDQQATQRKPALRKQLLQALRQASFKGQQSVLPD